jgi:hypothetical protein
VCCTKVLKLGFCQHFDSYIDAVLWCTSQNQPVVPSCQQYNLVQSVARCLADNLLTSGPRLDMGWATPHGPAVAWV